MLRGPLYTYSVHTKPDDDGISDMSSHIDVKYILCNNGSPLVLLLTITIGISVICRTCNIVCTATKLCVYTSTNKTVWTINSYTVLALQVSERTNGYCLGFLDMLIFLCLLHISVEQKG